MRSPLKWTEDDLHRLIDDQVSESLTLDYKASAALQRTDGKKADLSKDVSAFANSAGGILIYGLREHNQIPIEIDDGLDPTEISNEWIEQVVNSRVSRRIDGIGIHQIPLTGTRAGRVAYVVEVPLSSWAPHMASDHRYYKRFNFESVPMEDYEVRDVSRRLTAPILHLNATLVQDTGPEGPPILAQVTVSAENLSPTSADFALITFHATSANFPTVQGVEKYGETVLLIEEVETPVSSYKVEWRGGLRLPIMRGSRYYIADVSISIDNLVNPARLFWEILAPGAEPTRGAYIVQRNPERLVLGPCSQQWNSSQPLVWRI